MLALCFVLDSCIGDDNKNDNYKATTTKTTSTKLQPEDHIHQTTTAKLRPQNQNNKITTTKPLMRSTGYVACAPRGNIPVSIYLYFYFYSYLYFNSHFYFCCNHDRGGDCGVLPFYQQQWLTAQTIYEENVL